MRQSYGFAADYPKVRTKTTVKMLEIKIFCINLQKPCRIFDFMEKTAYFESLLGRDMLRYVLMRKPSLDDSDVISRLMAEIDVADIMGRLKAVIKDVIDEHISGRAYGDHAPAPAGHLDPWLRPGIVNDMMADYAARLDSLLIPADRIVRVMSRIESLTWIQGLGDMAEDIYAFMHGALKRADEYGGIPVSGPHRDVLMNNYQLAERITVVEHITGGNDEDIRRYLDTLHEYARARCEEVLYSKIAGMYRVVAGSEDLRHVADRFASMRLDLKDMDMKIPEPNPAWDAEYKHLVPVDFYERNIESIDGAMAFRMVLLQAFGRHEEELRAEGFLGSDGELRIFTNTAFDPFRWMARSIQMILN